MQQRRISGKIPTDPNKLAEEALKKLAEFKEKYPSAGHTPPSLSPQRNPTSKDSEEDLWKITDEPSTAERWEEQTSKKNIRILCVDDNPIELKVLTRTFEKFGYDNIQTAENGEEAMELIDQGFDLIIMDLQSIFPLHTPVLTLSFQCR